MAAPREHWTSGDAYERFIGRWSRPVGAQFLDWLGIPPGLRWLDVGCGTGALTGLILDRCDPSAVVGIDPSDGYVDVAARQLRDPRVRFAVADARSAPAEAFHVAVAGLVLNFVPDLPAALNAMRRAASGGTVAAFVWDYGGGMQMLNRFWRLAVELDPSAASLDEGQRFPLCRSGALERAFVDAGFSDVSGRAIDIDTVFTDFDDYWQPLLGGQGPAPTYLATLDDRRKETLREALRAELAPEPAGTITMTARAWAARGHA